MPWSGAVPFLDHDIVRAVEDERDLQPDFVPGVDRDVPGVVRREQHGDRIGRQVARERGAQGLRRGNVIEHDLERVVVGAAPLTGRERQAGDDVGHGAELGRGAALLVLHLIERAADQLTERDDVAAAGGRDVVGDIPVLCERRDRAEQQGKHGRKTHGGILGRRVAELGSASA
jgi:hypothetical protein